MLKPDEVTDSELQIEVGNLKTENEKLQSDYAALLESSTAVTTKLREEVREMRSQLAAEETRFDELREKLDDREETCGELRSKLADLKENSDSDFDSAGKAGELVSWLRKEVGKALPKQVTVKAIQKILEGNDD